MTIFLRSALAVTLFTGASIATPAFAQEVPSDVTASANVALVSDYRFRGISLSGGDFAIQGGVDVAHASGFYVGTWASSLDEDSIGYGSTELDLYAGYTTNLTDVLALDVGVLVYLYPDAPAGDYDYWEPYASISGTLGPASVTVGAAYAFDQSSLDFGADGGNDDNIYVYTDIGTDLPGTPVSLTAHLGYTDGVLSFDNDSTSFDWSIGASMSVFGPVEVGIAYVGVEAVNNTNPFLGAITDDTVVVSVGASF